MLIRDLPMDERPREKLLEHGCESLSNGELLAIILRVGTRRQSALSLADQVLAHFGSLELREARCEELQAIEGIVWPTAQILPLWAGQEGTSFGKNAYCGKNSPRCFGSCNGALALFGSGSYAALAFG